MKIVQDFSFGVVPLYKADVGYKVLLVHQIGRRGDCFWIFPKGHKEGNETPTQTAIRELKEETGVSEVTLLKDHSFVITYTFEHGGETIEKTVVYYIGIVKCMDVVVTQQKEIREVGWFTFAQAMDKVSHENTKYVLQEVQKAML